MSRRTLGVRVVELLEAAGVDTVFGIPGVHTMELFRGLAVCGGVRHVLTRHEQGAVFAADGYARASGRPGVAFLIGGPGVTNAATALAQAYHDSIPLLAICALPPRRARRGGGLHEMPDQVGFAAAVAGESVVVSEAEALPGALARAFAGFASGRPRPVVLHIPCELLAREVGSLRLPAVGGAPPEPPASRLAAARELLAPASRPLIVAGGGVLDAPASLAAFAEALDAVVVTTINGRGAIDDHHPHALGAILPTRAGTAALAEADLVVAVGTELGDADSYYAPEPLRIGGRLVRIDLDPEELADPRFPADVGLHGDADAVLRALTEALPPRSREAPERARAIRAAVEWWPQAAPLLPIAELVGTAVPDEAIVCIDSCQLGYVAQNVWPRTTPRTLLAPAGWGTLGPALPMALGAAVARPGAPVIAVVGDGGLLYTLGELAAIAALGLPVVVLLWSNDGYQEMRDEMDANGIPHIGTDAAAHDHEALARGFGIAHRRPTRDRVADDIAAALASGGPHVIELDTARLL